MFAKIMNTLRRVLIPTSFESFALRHDTPGNGRRPHYLSTFPTDDRNRSHTGVPEEVTTAHEQELERAQAVRNAFALIDAQVDGFRSLRDRQRPTNPPSGQHPLSSPRTQQRRPQHYSPHSSQQFPPQQPPQQPLQQPEGLS